MNIKKYKYITIYFNMKIVSKIVLVIFVLLTTNFMINSQSKFGHEWIDAGKTYYKLKVAQNGIYKDTYE